MSWAKIDDRANEHRKQLAAGAEACWLWTCGLMYANRQPSRDGFVPDAMIGLLFPLKSPKKLAEKLCEVELWHKVPGGYQIHEFELWNQGRQALEDERAKGRARAAKSYASRKPKTPEEQPEDSSESSGEEETKSGPESSGSSPPRAQTRAGSASPSAPPSPSPPPPPPKPPAVADDSGRIPCPPDLELTADQRAQLRMMPGVPDWAIDQVTAETRAKYADGSEPRTLERWRRTLVTIITGRWNDSSRRPSPPEGTPREPRKPLPSRARPITGPILDGPPIELVSAAPAGVARSREEQLRELAEGEGPEAANA